MSTGAATPGALPAASPGASPPARPLAVITGPTAGIGRAFAEALAARGHDLLLAARDEARLAALAGALRAGHGVAAEALPTDLATDGGVDRLVERIRGRTPDVLVNNAGFGTQGPIHRADRARQEAMVRLHALAPMRLAQAALPGMVARGAGALINVSSVASWVASPGNANYCATKAYLRVFTEALAAELRGTGVRVQALCPGYTHTEFHARLGSGEGGIPGWLWMEAAEVVEISLAAVARGGPVVCIPGGHYRAIVAALRHAPGWLLRRATGRYRRDGRPAP